MSKLISYTTIVFLFIMLISTPVYARDTDTGYEAGQTFDWAPSSSSISIEEYTTLFDFCYNIEWDTTGANLVNNLLDPPYFLGLFCNGM